MAQPMTHRACRAALQCQPESGCPAAPATGLAHEGRTADLRKDARADAHEGTFPDRLRKAANAAGIPSRRVNSRRQKQARMTSIDRSFEIGMEKATVHAKKIPSIHAAWPSSGRLAGVATLPCGGASGNTTDHPGCHSLRLLDPNLKRQTSFATDTPVITQELCNIQANEARTW